MHQVLHIISVRTPTSAFAQFYLFLFVAPITYQNLLLHSPQYSYQIGFPINFCQVVLVLLLLSVLIRQDFLSHASTSYSHQLFLSGTFISYSYLLYAYSNKVLLMIINCIYTYMQAGVISIFTRFGCSLCLHKPLFCAGTLLFSEGDKYLRAICCCYLPSTITRLKFNDYPNVPCLFCPRTSHVSPRLHLSNWMRLFPPSPAPCPLRVITVL